MHAITIDDYLHSTRTQYAIRKIHARSRVTSFAGRDLHKGLSAEKSSISEMISYIHTMDTVYCTNDCPVVTSEVQKFRLSCQIDLKSASRVASGA